MRRKYPISPTSLGLRRADNFQIPISILILLLAFFLRFYHLDRVPPSPSLDEVSLGWNAYSILQTGRDEYGTKFPILLRAYDDWRPALYVYLIIPFIKVFGLSVLSVRLPSVLLSLVTVLTVYFLTKELFRNSSFSILYSLFSILLLSLSPWHVYISRLGHEVNAGLTFSVLAIFFFLKAINGKRPEFLFLSSFFFALSLYTYQSQKIFGPGMLLALLVIFRKNLLLRKKEVVFAVILGLILLFPLIKVSLTPQALIRFQGTNIFSNQPELEKRSSLRLQRDYQTGNFLGLVFDRPIVAEKENYSHEEACFESSISCLFNYSVYE